MALATLRKDQVGSIVLPLPHVTPEEALLFKNTIDSLDMEMVSQLSNEDLEKQVMQILPFIAQKAGLVTSWSSQQRVTSRIADYIYA